MRTQAFDFVDFENVCSSKGADSQDKEKNAGVCCTIKNTCLTYPRLSFPSLALKKEEEGTGEKDEEEGEEEVRGREGGGRGGSSSGMGSSGSLE